MSKSPRDDLPGEAKSAGELTFEKALAELERIVNRMEAGELSLEQALASHKRGLELARFCQARLETAQQAGARARRRSPEAARRRRGCR
jgi:exodeoxyribonuclease VII small subunit